MEIKLEKSRIKKNIVKVLLALTIMGFISSTNKPIKIFLIGDSISIQYYPYLKEYVKGYAIIDRKEDDGKALKNLEVPMGANGGDSKMVLNYLKLKLKEPNFKPDYLLLNCGLHDIKHDIKTDTIQISESEYRSNLTEIFRLLKRKKIKPIWINTTWVDDSIHNTKSKAFKRYNTDVLRYNQIADEVCKKGNIPIIDLYSFSKNMGPDKFKDHVHYVQEAQKAQAKYIADFIVSTLK